MDAAQERGQLGLGQGGGGVAGGIAAQERDCGRRVQFAKQPDGARKAALELAGELVDQGHTGLDEILAGPAQRPQDLGGLAVRGQGGQAVAVGAQHISQHIGVGGVGLGPRGPIAAAQRFDLPRGNHHDLEAALQHRLHQRPVGPLDRHPGHSQLGQALDQPGEALAGVGDFEAGPDAAGRVNNAHRVGAVRPVDAGVVRRGWLLHLPPPSCHDHGTAGAGALHRLLIAWRFALPIPRAGLGAPARREPQISPWSSGDERPRRSPNGHRRFIGESHPPSPQPVGSEGRVHP